MAKEHPPSPGQEGFSLAFRRLRIESAMTPRDKPAMTLMGWGSLY